MRALSFKERWTRIRKFLADGVWDVELNSLPLFPRFGVKAIRVLQLVFKGFVRDECPLHASALTFSSLLAIVPLLGLSLALARGLGGDDVVKNKIRETIYEWSQSFKTAPSLTHAGAISESIGQSGADLYTPNLDVPRPEGTGISPENVANQNPVWDSNSERDFADQVKALVEQAFEKVDRVSFKALGGVGFVVLLLLVVQVLAQIEGSFNRVWGVAVGRPMWRKFTDYLSVILVLPALILATWLPLARVLGGVMTASGADQIRTWLTAFPWRRVRDIVTTCLAFSFLLMFMPNTKVKFGPGLIGGIVTGLLFLGWLWLCRAFQVGVAGYSRLYGSFAFVPILLAWAFTSWSIVLFGAEVAFAFQNCVTYRMEQEAREASMKARLMLALSVVMEAARAMLGPGRGLNVSVFAAEKKVPVRFLNDVVDRLVHAGVLAELSGQSGHYVLLKSPERLLVRDVLDGMMELGVSARDLGVDTLNPTAAQTVASLTGKWAGELGLKTIRQLVEADKADQEGDKTHRG